MVQIRPNSCIINRSTGERSASHNQLPPGQSIVSLYLWVGRVLVVLLVVAGFLFVLIFNKGSITISNQSTQWIRRPIFHNRQLFLFKMKTELGNILEIQYLFYIKCQATKE